MEELFNKFAKNYHVSRETFLQLSDYVELLLKWQQKINLISGSTANDIWLRHIEDSLQLTTYVSRETSAIIDIGSGGGMPGICLAIATKLPTFLVESDNRKCIFLSETARICKIDKCKILQSRAEKAFIKDAPTHGIIITARALAETTDLFSIIEQLILNNNISDYKIILPKGKTADIELSKAEKIWQFDYQKHKSITNDSASILEIKNLRRKA